MGLWNHVFILYKDAMLIIHVSGHHRDRIDERDDANFELLIAFVLGMSLRPCFRTLKIKIYQDRNQTLNNETCKKSTLLFSLWRLADSGPIL